MARQRQRSTVIAALAAVACLGALATPAAARGPDAFAGSRVDAADPLLAGLELNLEGVASVKRHLLQLQPNTPKYAPCDKSKELTCSGTPAAKAAGAKNLCCNKQNFACGVRSDNGQPRCAVCPQMCIFTCNSGFVCGKKDGCFQCLPVQCSATVKCPAGKLCDTRTPGGTCIPDPCTAKSPCPAATPVCSVNAALVKVCSAAKKKVTAPLKLAPVKALRRLVASGGSAAHV
ncbi:hypothetical protein C2E21_0656 [Chlorella sorokiniana]|jgi:hypothetical protein|uniref:Uncharacterized protein n=1 Tax=Chlorella sorokiniana TaxID=3076 RepID=A0A2P6U4K3_CHLSO|nr:hypothetical protein C2E21_0656 [Chlorella sorokiniana]|eukprot:PRW61237.1 hypothetical protein C2E21_0656 [Chlorella sorokiniana]